MIKNMNIKLTKKDIMLTLLLAAVLIGEEIKDKLKKRTVMNISPKSTTTTFGHN